MIWLHPCQPKYHSCTKSVVHTEVCCEMTPWSNFLTVCENHWALTPLPPLLTRERVFWNAHQLLSHVLKSFRGYSNSESLCAGLFKRAWCVWKYGMEVICLVALRFTVCRPSNSVDAFLTMFTFTRSTSIYAAAQWVGHAWFRAFPALMLVCFHLFESSNSKWQDSKCQPALLSPPWHLAFLSKSATSWRTQGVPNWHLEWCIDDIVLQICNLVT